MTTDLNKIAEILSTKHILLDNNVITRASDHPRAFRPFFTLLQNSNCKPVITRLIEFEFLRGAYKPEHKEKRQEFLNALKPAGFSLPNTYTEQSIGIAVKVANKYAERGLVSPNVVDCLLAAHVLSFEGRLFLATTNHKDFPTFLFDRIGVVTVDTEKEIFPIGIYGYSNECARDLGFKS